MRINLLYLLYSRFIHQIDLNNSLFIYISLLKFYKLFIIKLNRSYQWLSDLFRLYFQLFLQKRLNIWPMTFNKIFLFPLPYYVTLGTNKL